MILKTKIKLNVFDAFVIFEITDNVHKRYEHIKKRANETADEDDGATYLGLHFRSGGNEHILIDTKYVNYNVVSHEIFHAGKSMTTGRGVNDEETMALTIGCISKHIFTFLAKNNYNLIDGTKSK